MGVGKEEIERVARLVDQFVSQPPDPGPGVDNDNIIALGPDLRSGGVTAVFGIFRS